MRKPLMYMRSRGIGGSLFRSHSGVSGLSKSNGNFVGRAHYATHVPIDVAASNVNTVFYNAIRVEVSKRILFFDGNTECNPIGQFTVTGSATGVHTVSAVLHDPNDFRFFAIVTVEDFDIGETVTWDYVDGVCKLESLHDEVLPTGSHSAQNSLSVCSFSAFGHDGDFLSDDKPWGTAEDNCKAFRG